jgi:hypothetical protein
MFGTGDRASSAITESNNKMLLTSDGNLFLRGSVTNNGNPSDINLKTEIRTLENPLDKLEKLGGYSFTWSSNSLTPDKSDVGLIAQEVETILPHIVGNFYIDEVSYKTVNYNGVTALLVQAVNELSTKLNKLETEISQSKKY